MDLYLWLEKKEGGFWGVVVIFAAFMIQIPSFGTAQSFGIYNMYLLKYFKDASPAAVALIGSINVGVFLGSGNSSLFLSLFHKCPFFVRAIQGDTFMRTEMFELHHRKPVLSLKV